MREFDLEIAAESNLRINDSTFRPCDKPDDIIQYINKEPNHPPYSNKHLTASIEKRLSKNSSHEESPICYEDALNKAGYIHKVVYQTPSESNQ